MRKKKYRHDPLMYMLIGAAAGLMVSNNPAFVQECITALLKPKEDVINDK